MILNDLSKEERLIIATFIVRYTAAKLSMEQVKSCVELFYTHQLISEDDKDKYLSIPQPNNSTGILVMFFLEVAKFVKDDGFKALQEEYLNNPIPDTASSESEIEDIEFSLKYSDRMFLEQELEKNISNIPAMEKQLLAVNLKYLKQIASKCLDSENQPMKLSQRQCYTLKGWLEASIETSKKEKFKSIMALLGQINI